MASPAFATSPALGLNVYLHKSCHSKKATLKAKGSQVCWLQDKFESLARQLRFMPPRQVEGLSTYHCLGLL